MKTINFDHLACSPLLPEAREAMMPFLSGPIGNPLSQHIFGEGPKKAVEHARQNVASLINAQPEEIIFTSCGAQSNNLAIKGITKAQARRGKHIIASPIEHYSILHPLKGLQKQRYEISWLQVDSKGAVNPEQVAALIRKDTVLITVISASNEVETLEPIGEIGNIARENDIIFHTDAVACVGSIPIDVKELNIDLLSLAGNTFYGPLGTGALYIRKGISISPLIEGGIQERRLRARTNNVAGVVGMGAAAKAASDKLLERRPHLLNLRDRLIEGTLRNIPNCFLTGHPLERLPGHASFCIQFIEGDSILLHLDFLGIAGTSGSTCSSQALKASNILEAMRIDPVWARGSVVFSLGMDNTHEQIDFFLSELPMVVQRLREISPLAAKYPN